MGGKTGEDRAYIKHGITCPSILPQPDGDNHQLLALLLQLHLPAALLQAYHGCPDLLQPHQVLAPAMFLESLRGKAILSASLDGYKPTHPQTGVDALVATLAALSQDYLYVIVLVLPLKITALEGAQIFFDSNLVLLQQDN